MHAAHVVLEDSTSMPIYIYERPDGSRFEIRQGFNDQHLTVDPETGVPVRRVLQPAPIIFKGSGWYKTDSRATAAPKADGAAETPAAKPDGAESATKGETAEKPAAKTEAAAPAAKSDAVPTKPSAEAKHAAAKIAAAS